MHSVQTNKKWMTAISKESTKSSVLLPHRIRICSAFDFKNNSRIELLTKDRISLSERLTSVKFYAKNRGQEPIARSASKNDRTVIVEEYELVV